MPTRGNNASSGTKRASLRTRKAPAPTPIDRWEDVPQFANEAQEQKFWDTHTLGPALLASMKRGGPDDLRDLPTRTPTSSRTIAIRFEDDVLRRVRTVAERKGMGYQTLLKEFVIERLYEEEKREGLIA
ncbi:MAG TPA: CopG family antitoxin [Chloroflexota bacterium]|nr:CopG family antitoxin [Chloroflexota bacterium]